MLQAIIEQQVDAQPRELARSSRRLGPTTTVRLNLSITAIAGRRGPDGGVRRARRVDRGSGVHPRRMTADLMPGPR